jgi:hypothetical protein
MSFAGLSSAPIREVFRNRRRGAREERALQTCVGKMVMQDAGYRNGCIHGLSIDTIELYERNMIDELALRLVHGELPVGS